MLGGRKRGKEKEKSVVLARWQAGLMHSCKFSGYKDNPHVALMIKHGTKGTPYRPYDLL